MTEAVTSARRKVDISLDRGRGVRAVNGMDGATGILLVTGEVAQVDGETDGERENDDPDEEDLPVRKRPRRRIAKTRGQPRQADPAPPESNASQKSKDFKKQRS